MYVPSTVPSPGIVVVAAPKLIQHTIAMLVTASKALTTRLPILSLLALEFEVTCLSHAVISEL
jgi:hypothetical protein